MILFDRSQTLLSDTMSNVAETLANDRKRWRDYQQNRQSTESENVTPLVGFDVEPTDMSNDEIEKQYWHIQELREREMANQDPHNLAIEMSKRQMALFDIAKDRDFAERLANTDKSDFA